MEQPFGTFHPLSAVLRPLWLKRMDCRLWTAGPGYSTLDFGLWTLGFPPPPFMHPEPIRRVTPHSPFKGAIHVQHDVLGRARQALVAGRNFLARFHAPLSEADTVANARVKSAIIAERENGRSSRGGAVVAQERQPEAVARALVRKQTEQDPPLVHALLKGRCLMTPLEIAAAGTLPQRLEQPIERRLAQAAIRGDALIGRGKLAEAGIQLKISEVANRRDNAPRLFFEGRGWLQHRDNELDVSTQLFEGHCGRFDGAGVAFAQ